MVKPIILDFTNVKTDGGRFNRAHRVPGDYAAKITKVEDAKSKKSGEKMWLFTIKQGSATYPYYCQFGENVLWKLRNLAAAAGISIPSKRVKLNPDRLVGKDIGISLDDHEYDGKLMSEIISVFPTSELADQDDEPGEDDEDDEDETDEDEDTEDEDEDDEDEDEEPEPPKKSKKSKKSKGKKQDVADEELEELDIEDI